MIKPEMLKLVRKLMILAVLVGCLGIVTKEHAVASAALQIRATPPCASNPPPAPPPNCSVDQVCNAACIAANADDPEAACQCPYACLVCSPDQ